MIKKYDAIENAAIDNMFQCMDFLTAYKTFCEGPIENTLPSSLDVSLGQQYLTQILKKSICSLLNEKGLKQPQTFAEELWENREETFNSYASSLEANEIADCFYHNLFENEHFLLLKPVHYVTQEFFKNLRLDVILRESFNEVLFIGNNASRFSSVYENPEVPNSFGGVEALHRSVKGKYSKKDVKHWLSLKDAYTLHKPVRHKFQRNRVFVSDIDRQREFQADLVDMQSLAEFNKGYKYLLTCIDLFSKFAWAVPLKDKFGKSVKSGLEIIFKERKPKVLQTDAGKEFLNKIVQNCLKNLNVNFFTNNETKANINERFNRTLKTKMWKYFTEFNTKNYIDAIDKLIHSYNHSYHRSIKTEPVSVSRHNRKQVLKKLYGGLRNEKPKAPRIKIGDVVRINKQKLHFEKGYEQNWRRELFIVLKSQRIPIVYRLKDLQGEEIKGTYYTMQNYKKLSTPGFYPVENVIKQKKKTRNH
ncbi:putative uncharacterized transposon-derived protein F54H12.3 [Trichonephila clavipes]|uniref:Uncharacterized transposon-derived protein F54H12.3 n=1 Tax=Trichonephila clavipes TaxID=2585209 RepID=A0A8X6W3D7_TRICX|nr:putative uncharacterized transposon-derived protein F54H12.3 [Trichonephila clavipes]